MKEEGKKLKVEYEVPQYEIILFDTVDIISTSDKIGEGGGEFNDL